MSSELEQQVMTDDTEIAANDGDFNASYATYTGVPRTLLQEEVSGLYGEIILRDLSNIIRLYSIYDKGARFRSEGAHGDYIPADLRYRQAKVLVDKQARFMFSNPPDFTIDIPTKATDGTEAVKINKQKATIMQDFLGKVMSKNKFSKKLLQAGKDCFIGKRIAVIVNLNGISGISVSFIPSLEFVYETDPTDTDIITKLVTFYTIRDSQHRAEQRIYKKRYSLEDTARTTANPSGKVCHILEATYDGTGHMVEETFNENSKFSYIPATVIVNDGLTGDLNGESEIELLRKYEAWYSRLSNADMDAQRKGMNPIRFARDMSANSTKNLSAAAGAFWDLTSEDAERPGDVGIIESQMGYSSSLGSTLDRIKAVAYEALDMPDTSSAALKGVVSSGKTLKAIYWGLITRCEEKWLAWRPALEFIAHCIIDGAKFYPDIAKEFTEEALPDIRYNILVENNYPIPEDEAEEKMNDIAEVNSQAMSRKSYMKKWRGMTDEDADEELKQLAKEKAIFEDSAFAPTGSGGVGGTLETTLDTTASTGALDETL